MRIEATKRPDAVLIGRCKVCKTGHREVMSPVFVREANGKAKAWPVRYLDASGAVHKACNVAWSDGVWIDCPNCKADGKVNRFHLKVLRGKFKADKKCSARCMNATGPSCECVCAGANHGAGWC